MRRNLSFFFALALGVVLMSVGCSVDSAKNHYVLAEKLWTDHKYAASVSEFEKVVTKDPRGKLGTQALLRAAMTQYLFLSDHHNALQKLRQVVQIDTDPKTIWEAQLQIGDILFLKMEQYDQVILHYSSLLKWKPQCHEAPEFFFRIGKSNFYLFQFDEALKVYEEMRRTYAGTVWAEKATYELGVTYFTRGEQHSEDSEKSKESYQAAIRVFQKFMRQFPKSQRVPEARFGVASCLEELDQLEEALQTYISLRGVYPSPQVIEVKLSRIRQRMAQRSNFH